MPAKIIIYRGLPASGKTTAAKEYCKNHPNTIRVNRDDIRAMLSLPYNKVLEREVVIKSEVAVILNALIAGYDVIIDDTNLTSSIDDIIRDVNIGYYVHANDLNDREIEYVDFFDVPIETCIERDSKREHPVGEARIRKMYKDYELRTDSARIQSRQEN